MMHYFKNILLFTLLLTLSVTALNAQHSHKKKKKATTSKPAKKQAVSSKKGKRGSGAATRQGTPAVPLAESKVAPIDLSPQKKETINVSEMTIIQDTTSVDDTLSTAKEVIITSSFKPSLRNASKINFTAATPLLDTTKLQLTYNIPSQNLFFSYQPVPIKPLALAADSAFTWEQNLYVKAGYGNFSSPYLEAGASFGDGKKSMITAHAKYQSAKGSLPLQEYKKMGIDLLGVFTTKKNQEITSKVYWNNNSVYRYGYKPDSLKVNGDTLRNKFNSIGFAVGFANKTPTAYGITYHPQLDFNAYFNTSATKETNIIIKAPVNKAFSRLFILDLIPTADITHYSNKQFKDTVTINNNIYSFNFSLRFNTPNFKANIGLIPAWDNGKFALLPNFTAEKNIAYKKLLVSAGWIGYFQKNNYKNLSETNPYIIPVSSLFNTKINEGYVGAKGSISNHITANAKLSFLNMDNTALYVNDTIAGSNQNFLVVNEPSIQALRLKGEISYSNQEKLSILAGATYTQFTKLSVNNKAYGLLPLEIYSTLHWKVLNDLTLKSDLFFFDGSYYRNQTKQSSKLTPAFDANLGAEFPVMKKLDAWIQFNNFLNNHYQRWNQYQVLGFQLLAGVVYSFR